MVKKYKEIYNSSINYKEEFWKEPNYKSCNDEPSRFEKYVNEWFLIEEENFDKFIDLVLLPSVA